MNVNDLIESIPSIELIQSTSEFIIGNKNCKIKGYRKWWNKCGDIITPLEMILQ